MIGRVEDLISKSKQILSQPSIKAGERKELLEALRMLQQRVEDDMPFVHTQFNRAMDQTVAEAKGEVEAFFANTVTRLGLDTMKQQIAGKTIPAPPQIAVSNEPPVIDAEFKGGGEK